MSLEIVGLKKYAQNKSKVTQEKAEISILKLLNDNKKVNFNSVSKHSGISKSFLYNNKKIKQEIEKIRINQNKRDLTNNYFEKIKSLEIENQSLKEEINILKNCIQINIKKR